MRQRRFRTSSTLENQRLVIHVMQEILGQLEEACARAFGMGRSTFAACLLA